MSETTTTTAERIDWKEVSDKLQNLLRLRTLPVGMKLFKTVEEMEAIPKIRRPKKHHTTCQIVTQARQVGWTVGVTIDNLMPGNCGAVIKDTIPDVGRGKVSSQTPGRCARSDDG